MEGSARIDGQPAEAELLDGVLRVHGVVLGPSQRVSVTYLARPRLLGKPSPHGQALRGDVPLSLPEQGLPAVAAPGGCGCHTAGPDTLAGLALVWAVSRRMRARRRLSA